MAQASWSRAPFGMSSAKRSRPGRAGGEAAVNDVVHAQAAPRGLEDRLAARAGGRGLDEPVAGAEQVHGLGGAAAAGEEKGEGGGRRHGEGRSHHTSRPS